MQLIHIERVSATSDEQRLGFLLKARAKAAEQVVAAILRSQMARQDLIEHVTRRLQAGANKFELRHMMLKSGMPRGAVLEILGAATDAVRPDRVTGGASQQTDFPEFQT